MFGKSAGAAPSITRRTLHYYGRVTAVQMPMFLLNVVVTLGYVFFLSFLSPAIVGRIVDMVGADRVAADDVLPVFGPLIAAFVAANVAGQVCSKLQDYSCAKLEIAASFELGRQAFDEKI